MTGTSLAVVAFGVHADLPPSDGDDSFDIDTTPEDADDIRNIILFPAGQAGYNEF
ncbi:hypothetical protein HFO56_00545 [Rhizobium laguerreae]|uniref:hypothetical protein n=1 Tax=Rhizobium laguerreae TaxID=1076926 RepID=UPI001C91013B|nr:hypothetical protein [Rhizobium laguerreae]MBY3150917.1 hypothetical protein [Rhizobium laguerreae]